ncbi:hypothetical protein EV361DRAFT_275451 [Lentinula raphanica]|nr:hypothetical protein EV361DRAFT_275451 [Lentinula raphanica]
MVTRSRQLLYVFFIVNSTLVVSLLDLLKQSYADVMNGIYIDVALFSWLPMSFFITAMFLPVKPDLEAGAGSTQIGQPKDIVALLGCGHTWLNLNRLVSGTPVIQNFHTLHRLNVHHLHIPPAISDRHRSNCTIPSPLLFAFCYAPEAIIVSLLLTIILYGLCLQACDIEERRWGYFQSVYSMVAFLLTWLLDLFQHIVTLKDQDKEYDHP